MVMVTHMSIPDSLNKKRVPDAPVFLCLRWPLLLLLPENQLWSSRPAISGYSTPAITAPMIGAIQNSHN